MTFHYCKTALAEELCRTKTYVDYASPGEQDNVLMKFCRENHLSADYAKSVWKEMYEKKYGKELAGEYGRIFNSKWRNCTKVKLNEHRYCMVYQEDIDLVNSLHFHLVWEKQIVLAFLVQFRLSETKRLWNLHIPDYYKLVGKPRDGLRAEDSDIVNEMKRVGLVKECSQLRFNEYAEDEEDEWIKSFWYEVNDPVEGKQVLGMIDKTVDIKQFFGFLNTNKICPVCGVEFEPSIRSQTDLCHECWKKKRNIKKNFLKDGSKRIHKKGDTLARISYMRTEREEHTQQDIPKSCKKRS